MMRADVVIAGGGVIGSSIAYYLAASGQAGDVVVVEPDPTYEFAATPRSVGGIRELFTLPENIAMSQYGKEVYGNFAALMAVDGDAPDINFRRQGYLFLGSGAVDVDTLVHNWKIQARYGAHVELLDRQGVKSRFPSLTVTDIDAAAWSPTDGFLDPHAALHGFRKKAVSLGARYLTDRVVGFECSADAVRSVRLESGAALSPDIFINAANCWGPALCALVGMQVPVHPLRRQQFFFRIRDKLEPLPNIRHISRDIGFRPEGDGYMSGKTRYDEKPGFNWEVEHELFETDLWPELALRVPAFEALKVASAWAGHYDQNTFDNNVILGPWTGGLANFHVALGFSGHGLQQAPAIGRAMKELIVDGGFRSIDLARFSYQRIIDNIPVREHGPVA